MKKEQAEREIKQKISEAEILIKQSTELADQYGIEFNMDYGRGHEGGDTYYGKGNGQADWLDKNYYIEYGWVTSTMSCS